MLFRILKELIIFLCCLSAYPGLLLLLLVFADPWRAGRFIMNDAMPAVMVPAIGNVFKLLWLKVLAPYALVQAIRAHLWSQRSIIGRKWANLYFAAMFGAGTVWSLSKFWDLFVFMAALGDIPAELRQLFEIEGHNLLIALVSAVLALHCLRTFLDPMRKPPHPRMLEHR